MNKLAEAWGYVSWRGAVEGKLVYFMHLQFQSIAPSNNCFFLEGSFKSSYRVRRFLGGLTVFVQPEVCD